MFEIINTQKMTANLIQNSTLRQVWNISHLTLRILDFHHVTLLYIHKSHSLCYLPLPRKTNYTAEQDKWNIHLVCFISNVYKQRFFQPVKIFENISNTTGWTSKY